MTTPLIHMIPIDLLAIAISLALAVAFIWFTLYLVFRSWFIRYNQGYQDGYRDGTRFTAYKLNERV